MSLYGYCPQCGERGVRRERRLGGNDTCEAGHTYPTAQSHSQPDALIALLTRERSDHAAELAEWKQRAERAEAYVAGHDQWSTFKTAEEMHAELVRVRTQRDSLCLAFNKANKENTLLRAECEACRSLDKVREDTFPGQPQRYAALSVVLQARAATDAAGILKGAE